MPVNITDIEDHLMQLNSLHWINRRENPDYIGDAQLPAITVDYAYTADGQTPVSRQTDALDITITTAATDGATGAADIDAALGIDADIFAILDGWNNDASGIAWRRTGGGNVSRETGFCQSVVRYRRERYRDSCE